MKHVKNSDGHQTDPRHCVLLKMFKHGTEILHLADLKIVLKIPKCHFKFT